jgi:DNA-binding transcriptional ArsR family regulator
VGANHSAQLDALGDPTRRAILSRLVNDGALPVVEIARDFPMSRPAISQHLRVLKDAHLVVDRAEGTRRLYAVNPDALASLRRYFEGFWLQALASFKRTAEQEARRTKRRKEDSRAGRRTKQEEHR